MKGLTVKHTPILLSVLEIDLFDSASFASEIKVFTSGIEWVEHVFAGAAKEHSIELEKVSVLLKGRAMIIELIIVVFQSLLG